MGKNQERTIVVSAVNFNQGGPLSILVDCLKALCQIMTDFKIRVIVLVHKKELVDDFAQWITILEFPEIKGSWIKRLRFEYFSSSRLSESLRPDLWLALHDITPNIDCPVQMVYCHNPAPFFKLSFEQKIKDVKFTLFNAFYKYLYAINIKRNAYVIVQQSWLRDEFYRRYNVKTIVAYPHIETANRSQIMNNINAKFLIFYPSFPRIFKNFEVILEAAKILSQERNDFEIIITIDGTENAYSKSLYKRFSQYNFVRFIGKISRDEVYRYYEKVSCLVFPSKLETWGLPLTEFKDFNKPILATNLPYAKETIGEYEKVKFFDPDNPEKLAEYINALMNNNLEFDGNKSIIPEYPFAANWQELFEIILKD